MCKSETSLPRRPHGFLYYVIQTIRARRKQGIPLVGMLHMVPNHTFVERDQGDFNAVGADGVERGVRITFEPYSPLEARATIAEIFKPVLDTLFGEGNHPMSNETDTCSAVHHAIIDLFTAKQGAPDA